MVFDPNLIAIAVVQDKGGAVPFLADVFGPDLSPETDVVEIDSTAVNDCVYSIAPIEDIGVVTFTALKAVIAPSTVQLVTSGACFQQILAIPAIEAVADVGACQRIARVVALDHKRPGHQAGVVHRRAIGELEAINGGMTKSVIRIKAGQPHHVSLVTVRDQQEMPTVFVCFETQAIAQ